MLGRKILFHLKHQFHQILGDNMRYVESFGWKVSIIIAVFGFILCVGLISLSNFGSDEGTSAVVKVGYEDGTVETLESDEKMSVYGSLNSDGTMSIYESSEKNNEISTFVTYFYVKPTGTDDSEVDVEWKYTVESDIGREDTSYPITYSFSGENTIPVGEKTRVAEHYLGEALFGETYGKNEDGMNNASWDFEATVTDSQGYQAMDSSSVSVSFYWEKDGNLWLSSIERTDTQDESLLERIL